MNSAANTTLSSPGLSWHGPGGSARARRELNWHSVLWAVIFPKKRHRIALTVPGVFLMVLAMGIGTAAYNTASNILFMTLSLLLACLLLSGLLSWFNFMNLSWRLRPPGAWRAGHETLVTVEVRNGKRWLPSYSIWFELAAQPPRIPEPEHSGRELKMREVLAAAEAERCLDCKNPTCIDGCPVRVNIPRFIALLSEGDLQGAAESLLDQKAGRL